MTDIYFVEAAYDTAEGTTSEIIAVCKTEELATKAAKKCVKELLEERFSWVEDGDENIKYDTDGSYSACIYDYTIQVLQGDMITEEAETDDFERGWF